MKAARRASRYECTAMFREVGLFGFAELLNSQGISSPAEQIAAVWRFVVDALPNAAPSIDAPKETLAEWSRRPLLEAAEAWRRESPNVHTWRMLALKSLTVIAWEPYSEFAELLCVRCGQDAFARTAERLRRRGFSVQIDVLLDLRNEFTVRRLPNAVKTFDPAKGVGKEVEWLSTVFYRFAIHALVSDRINRFHLSEMPSLFGGGEMSPEEISEDSERESAALALPRHLSTLPHTEQHAVALYFGLNGEPEATLLETAKRLGISQYRARNAVVLGLARLATLLGSRGVLDDVEFEYAKLLFEEGMSPDAAARRLNIQKAEVQSRIAHKFRRVLRPRTTRLRDSFPSKIEDIPMGTHNVGRNVKEDIVGALKQLKQAPHTESNTDGASIAFLPGDLVVPVHAIQEVLDRDLIEELDRSNIPLDWLVAGGSTDRADLLANFALDTVELEGLKQRRWIVAETLWRLCEDRAKFAAWEDSQREHSVERVFRTLTGAGQAIRSELSDSLRGLGQAEFRISRSSTGVMGQWIEGGSQPFDLKSMVEDTASHDGELSPELSALLADIIVRGLLNGEFALPSLVPLPGANGDTASFTWTRPKLQRANPTQRMKV